MNNKNQKLELTWIGKENQPRLEPRIVIEDAEKSFGDKNTENMLIHGDNLLALKALEQDFAGKIKCIYIDPPYNTGARINSDGEEVGYDDGLEHSEWLNMMQPRLKILKTLLSEDGTFIVQIDDREFARLYLLMVDIFREDNLKTICVKMSEATGVKMAHVINKGRIPKLKEFLIIARKNGIKDLYLDKIPKEAWDEEYKHVIHGISRKEIQELKNIMDSEEFSENDILRADAICTKINLQPITSLDNAYQSLSDEKKTILKYENAWRIVRDVATTDGAKRIADEKRNNVTGDFFLVITPQKKRYLIKKNYNLNASQPRIKLLFADDYLTIHTGDFWHDIKTTGLDNEGGVDFKKGKKPEALIKRIISMATEERDWVLDSFAGSGTTGAVAHKINRKWIMIEMANHCHSHIIPRLTRVITGEDKQGISEMVNWQGGGGFKYYYLAPSLLKEDKYGNWIIDERYNANMLAAAMAKHEGFKYSPDEQIYWKQGKSTEKDYIFTTTKFVTMEFLDKIHDEMQADESLLICCKSFSKPCESRYPNITVKKIPKMLLGRCEFGKEDYSLNIVNMPLEEDPSDIKPVSNANNNGKKKKPKVIASNKQLSFLDGGSK